MVSASLAKGRFRAGEAKQLEGPRLTPLASFPFLSLPFFSFPLFSSPRTTPPSTSTSHTPGGFIAPIAGMAGAAWLAMYTLRDGERRRARELCLDATAQIDVLVLIRPVGFCWVLSSSCRNLRLADRYGSSRQRVYSVPEFQGGQVRNGVTLSRHPRPDVLTLRRTLPQPTPDTALSHRARHLTSAPPGPISWLAGRILSIRIFVLVLAPRRRRRRWKDEKKFKDKERLASRCSKAICALLLEASVRLYFSFSILGFFF